MSRPFFFATGIENSYPTIDGARRIDQTRRSVLDLNRRARPGGNRCRTLIEQYSGFMCGDDPMPAAARRA